MRSLEAVQILRERLTDDTLVVASLGTPSYLLHAAGDRHLNFYLWAAMGMASSTGLGLALAQPNRRVVVLDGDGAALMNLGGMVTVGMRQPPNLLWMILENGAFLETGGQPIATHSTADLVGLGQASGIRWAARATNPETLAAMLDAGLATAGPALVVARVERDSVRTLPPVDPIRVKLSFMDALGT
jgi:phosphonopyruvate decarboxylase